MNKHKRSKYHVSTRATQSYLANDDVYLWHATEANKDTNEPIKNHALRNISHSGPTTINKDTASTIRRHTSHNVPSKPISNDIPLLPLVLSVHSAKPDLPVARQSVNSSPEPLLLPANPSIPLFPTNHQPVPKTPSITSRKHVMSDSPYYTTTSDEMDLSEGIPNIILSDNPTFVAEQVYNMQQNLNARRKPKKKVRQGQQINYSSEEEY